MRCAKWASERVLLDRILSVPDIKWFNLLGGSKEGEGVPPDSLQPMWLKGSNIPTQEGIAGADSGFAQVARFLLQICWKRKKLIARLNAT
jgi:hypothetical protein